MYFIRILSIIYLSLTGLSALSATTNTFNPYYLDLLKTAEDNPQKSLEQLISIDTVDFSKAQKAERLYFESLVYGYLDYPNKVLERVNSGLQLIDPKSEPWLFHYLTLEKVHAWERNGLGLKGFTEVENALNWAIQNQDLQLQLNSMYVLSGLYIQTEDYDKALSIIHRAYDMAPEEGREFIKADFTSQLSAVYIYRHEFEIALPYLQQDYEHQLAQNNQLGMSVSLYELGRAHLALMNFDQGIQHLNESIGISKNIDDLQGMAYAYNELASHYFKSKQNHSLAESYLLKSTELFSESNNLYQLFETHLLLSQIYASNGQIKSAEEQLLKAQNQIIEDESPDGMLALKRQHAKILSAKGESNEAFKTLLETVEEQQILDSKVSTQKLHQIRTAYEVDANNQRNQLLAKTNLLQEQQIEKQLQLNQGLIVLLITAVLFIFTLIFFAFKFKKQSNRMHQLANFDELTGLKNRHSTIKSVRNQFNQLSDSDTIYLIMVDLDHFKSINDRYGHALGDKVLTEFGSYCRQIFTDSGIIGRIGGEEFLICLVNYETTEVKQLMEKLRMKTEQMQETIKAPDFRVSLSAGICMSTQQNKSFHQLFKCSDQAMYDAKNAGRNQVFFNHE